MKPAPFDYYAPESLDEAVSLLGRLEDEDVEAKILAGGQSLMPMLNFRMARPDALVDLRKLDCLNYIRDEGEVIAIGAMTTKSTAEDASLIQEKQPLFHAVTKQVAHRQIRNRGTIGGSFAHADPAAEYGAVATALGLTMRVVGPDGERVIPAADFYVTYLTTDIGSTEILTEIRLPVLPAGTGWSFQEMVRRDGGLAMAGAIVTARLEGGKCADARIAVFGINATATRLESTEQFINGQAPSEEIFAEAGRLAAAGVEEPLADAHASSDYRRHLVEVFVTRCLGEAVSRAA